MCCATTSTSLLSTWKPSQNYRLKPSWSPARRLKIPFIREQRYLSHCLFLFSLPWKCSHDLGIKMSSNQPYSPPLFESANAQVDFSSAQAPNLHGPSLFGGNTDILQFGPDDLMNASYLGTHDSTQVIHIALTPDVEVTPGLYNVGDCDLDLPFLFHGSDFELSLQGVSVQNQPLLPFEEALPPTGFHSSSPSTLNSYDIVNPEANEYTSQHGTPESWNMVCSRLEKSPPPSNFSLPSTTSQIGKSPKTWLLEDFNFYSSLSSWPSSVPLFSDEDFARNGRNYESTPSSTLIKGAPNVNESSQQPERSAKKKRRIFTSEEKQKMNFVRSASACIRCQILKEDVS